MRKWTGRSKRLLVAVGLMGLALTACGGDTGGNDATDAAGAEDSGENASGGEESTELRIAATGVDSLPFMAILQVGADKGFFEDEGLDVSFLSGSGGGNTLRLLSTDDADIAITGGTAVVKAAMADDSTRIIGSWFQVNDFFWISPEPVDSLDGATLGATSAGSTTELVCSYLQEKSEADITCELLGGGMGDSWAAARSGNITAGWAMHPFVTDKVENEGANIAVAAREVIGDFPADLVAVRAGYADEHPEAVEAFFRAAEKVQQYLVEDTDAAAADLSPILNIDAELLAAGLKDTPDLATAYSLKIQPDALETLSDMMVFSGQIDEPIDWSTMLDQSYLPEDARADL
jgi:NitT/TauT family transport system substrate-binding protein